MVFHEIKTSSFKKKTSRLHIWQPFLVYSSSSNSTHLTELFFFNMNLIVGIISHYIFLPIDNHLISPFIVIKMFHYWHRILACHNIVLMDWICRTHGIKKKSKFNYLFSHNMWHFFIELDAICFFSGYSINCKK